MKPSTYGLILFSTLCNIGAQLMLKRAIAGGAPSRAMVEGPAAFVLGVIAQPVVWAALALQVAGYISWFFVLSRGQVAVVFAISGSFFYLLMAGSAWLVLGERLSTSQWIGLTLISAGVIFVGSQGVEQ